MAKRRNLKKEKAERNQAFARKFRKKSSRYFSRNKRSHSGYGSNGGFKKPEEESSSWTKKLSRIFFALIYDLPKNWV